MELHSRPRLDAIVTNSIDIRVGAAEQAAVVERIERLQRVYVCLNSRFWLSIPEQFLSARTPTGLTPGVRVLKCEQRLPAWS